MSSSIVIKNSKDATVATVPPKTVDTSTPITLIGRGYAGHAKLMNENWFHVLENFSHTTAPSGPVRGMLWNDETNGLKLYNGTAWELIATGANADVKLARLSSANNINFATAASHQLHTGTSGVKTIITSILLIPNTGASVAGAPPSFALETSTNAADIADKVVMAGLTGATKYSRHVFQGSNSLLQSGSTVSLNIKTAITGGDTLVCNAYLYGLII